MIWNIAGLKNKDKEFFQFIKEYEVIGLIETWVEEKEWGIWRRRLPKGWKWECQGAQREKKKGRARGGIITGVKEAIQGRRETVQIQGAMRVGARLNGREWGVYIIYNRRGEKKFLEGLDRWIEENEGLFLIGGDWNARVGNSGSMAEEERGERKSKITVSNTEGKNMMDLIGKRGWIQFDGNKEGDEEVNWTYGTKNSITVIDYRLTNGESWDKMKMFEVGYRLESDHQPLLIELQERKEYRRKKEEEKERKTIKVWGQKKLKSLERGRRE